jgi:hypothetical protein
MAYDSATRRPVFFGGLDAKGFPSGTWSWNGTSWQQLDSPRQPTPRYGASTADDQATRQVVLFGGNDGGALPAATWIWTARRPGPPWSASWHLAR